MGVSRVGPKIWKLGVLDCSKFVPDSYTRQVKEIQSKKNFSTEPINL